MAEMEEVSRQAAEILLAEPAQTPGTSDDVSTRRPGARRVTRPMAEALVQLADLVQPVAEAAHEWLESKDDEDPEAIAEARERLLATLDETPELPTTMARLVRLLASVVHQAGRGSSHPPRSSDSTPPHLN